ncbi:MAG: hypothetical protein JWM93_2371 [Frankiales bacterium]|nr:hypothetical protein [Frankiales bacterium]
MNQALFTAIEVDTDDGEPQLSPVTPSALQGGCARGASGMSGGAGRMETRCPLRRCGRSRRGLTSHLYFASVAA